MNKVHHIGIASEDLNLALYALGTDKSKIKEVIDDTIQHNILHFIHQENSDLWIEIIIPKNDNSTIQNFVKKNKMGLHHIGFLCDNINDVEQKFNSSVEAVKLGKYHTTVDSFGGKISTIFFAIKGMIVEYVETGNE
jgi:hypothetical protein|tara:strand:- start:351 stop:761 length:411 start_codon:yes stop_codon:yes gene_type:complete